MLDQFGVFYAPVQIFFDSGLANASSVDMLIYQCSQECRRDCAVLYGIVWVAGIIKGQYEATKKVIKISVQ